MEGHYILIRHAHIMQGLGAPGDSLMYLGVAWSWIMERNDQQLSEDLEKAVQDKNFIRNLY